MSIIRELDPVQGLLNFVLDVKPYHTKVVSIVTEYVHTDVVDVSFTETFNLAVQFDFPTPLELQTLQSLNETTINGVIGSFGSAPFGSPNVWPVVSFDQTANGPFDAAAFGYDEAAETVILPGDRTVEYAVGTSVDVQLYNRFDTPLSDDPQTLIIFASEFIAPTNVNEIAHTKLTLPGLIDPTTVTNLPLTEVYASVNLTPFPIASVIVGFGAGSANEIQYTDVPPGTDPSPLPTPGSQIQGTIPDENNFTPTFVNSYVVSGDVSQTFVTGSIVEVVGTSIVFRVLMSTFDGSNTYIRSVEPIPPNTSGDLRIRELLVGYGESFSASSASDGSLSTAITERLSFSWSDPSNTDVIDGYQFLIQSIKGSDVLVNGKAEGIVQVGDQIQLLESPSNAQTPHTVSAVSGSTITLTSTLTDSIGGWIEKYES